MEVVRPDIEAKRAERTVAEQRPYDLLDFRIQTFEGQIPVLRQNITLAEEDLAKRQASIEDAKRALLAKEAAVSVLKDVLDGLMKAEKEDEKKAAQAAKDSGGV